MVLAAAGAADDGVAREIRAHDDTTYDVAFSPDGSLLASASFDRSIKLWKTADASLAGTLVGHGGKVLSVAFSGDGSLLLSASEDKTVKIWSMPSTGPGRLAGHAGVVRAVELSPGGKWLASASADRTVKVWRRGAGKVVLALDDLGEMPVSLAFDDAVTRLAAGFENGSVRVWSLPVPKEPEVTATGEAALIAAGSSWRYFKGDRAPPAEWRGIAFDDAAWAQGASGFGYSSTAAELATVKTRLDDMAGGKYLSVFVRHAVEIADPKRVEKMTLRVIIDDGFVAYLNGKEVGRANIEGDSPAHGATAVSASEPAEQTVDLTPHLGLLKPGKNVVSIQAHNANPTSSDFVLTPSLSAVLREEKEEAKGPGAELARVDGVGSAVDSIAFAPDGKLLATGGRNGAVRLWSLDGKEVKSIDGPGPVTGIAFLDGKTLLSSRGDGSVRILGVDGSDGGVIKAHEGGVSDLAIHRGSKLATTCGKDGSVVLWNAAAKSEAWRMPAHSGGASGVAISEDGKTVTSVGADGRLHVWNASDGAKTTTFEVGGAAATCAASSDGRYYTAGAGNDILRWRSATVGELRTLSGHEKLVYAVTVSPDGQLAASGSADKTVRLWNVADGKQVRSINAHDGSAYCVAFSPDGSRVASGGYDKKVKIWNVADGKEVKALAGHEEAVFAVHFLPDGEHVISGSSDHTLRIWKVDSGEAVKTLGGHPGWVSDLGFAGAQRVVSSDYGGNLFFWRLDTAEKFGERLGLGTIHAVATTPDGTHVATASADGRVLLIGVPD